MMLALLAKAFKAVIAEKVALCLNDIRRAMPLPHAVIPCKRGGKRGNGMAALHGPRHDLAQRGDTARKHLRKAWRKDQLPCG